MGGYERRRSTNMAVKHPPILIYGGDISLQSNKKKSYLDIIQYSYY